MAKNRKWEKQGKLRSQPVRSCLETKGKFSGITIGRTLSHAAMILFTPELSIADLQGHPARTEVKQLNISIY
jgi:hypothetical protein